MTTRITGLASLALAAGLGLAASALTPNAVEAGSRNFSLQVSPGGVGLSVGPRYDSYYRSYDPYYYGPSYGGYYDNGPTYAYRTYDYPHYRHYGHRQSWKKRAFGGDN